MREGAGGEKGRKRRMEAEISQGPAGAPKGTPGDAKCVTEILWEGAKIRKLGWGKNKMGKLILSKKNKIVAATQTFAPGGKYRRAATALFENLQSYPYTVSDKNVAQGT